MAIKRREIAISIILSIVTCGIYGIIWILSMVKEAVSVKDPADSATMEIILTILLPFVGMYMTEKKFAEGCMMRGIPHEDRSVLYLVLGIVGFGIVAVAMMQNDLNKLAPPAAPNAPYGQPTAPYGQPAAPYGQPAQPYGQPAAPYGQPAAPYGQPTAPAAPYGQPAAPAAPYGQPAAPAAPYGQPAQPAQPYYPATQPAPDNYPPQG